MLLNISKLFMDMEVRFMLVMNVPTLQQILEIFAVIKDHTVIGDPINVINALRHAKQQAN
jgi:hypothetical protein